MPLSTGSPVWTELALVVDARVCQGLSVLQLTCQEFLEVVAPS